MFRAHAFAESPVPEAALEVILPKDGKTRSRTVVSRSRACGTGKYPSWKMGRMVQWESPNELNALRLLDADPAANSFQEQPLVIRYQLQGEAFLHYPDLLVEWDNGRRELWEIKPAREAALPQVSARTEFLKSALPRLGFEYRMLIAEDLKQEPYLSNALVLLKYGREPVGNADRERIRQILQAVPAIRWASAVKGDLGPRGRAILCRLTLEGSLFFDRGQKLTELTAFGSTTSREFST